MSFGPESPTTLLDGFVDTATVSRGVRLRFADSGARSEMADYAMGKAEAGAEDATGHSGVPPSGVDRIMVADTVSGLGW